MHETPEISESENTGPGGPDDAVSGDSSRDPGPSETGLPGESTSSARGAGPGPGIRWGWVAGGAGFIAVCTVLLALLHARVAGADGATPLDTRALAWAVDHRTPWLETVVTGFTHIGGPVGMTILSVLLVVCLGWRYRTWWPLVLVAVTAAGSLLWTVLGKEIVGRERPDLAFAVPPFETSPSFPSGHTLNATAIMTVVVYVVVVFAQHRWEKILAVVVCTVYCLLIGLSRIYLGHHWVTDVLAGYLIGLAWAVVVILAHHMWVKRSGGVPGSAGSGTMTA